ncbi:vWA domain-containing protein [Corynebacterium gerontici]|uniref:von Willebrand factor type A domain protein n=1 Tax=Corynebacterium gerontici TaxID=2079234 RepID=A0A3G6J0E0_9CORY|nr:vWA domain-containing protein [Corynebacterium gerontici]AZA11386.1 von Willebrand factor type A domain protein [Corynebacterium gerontici]
MGQHSLGTPNYRLSKELIAGVTVVVLVVAAVLLWSNQRLRSDEEHSARGCIEGELTVPIAVHGKMNAAGIVDKLSQQQAIVRDYCVKPKLVDDPAQAAVLLSAETERTIRDVLDRSQRTPASNTWPIIAAPAVGVATRADGAGDVRYPTSPDAVASAILAFDELGNADATYQLLERERGVDLEQAESESDAIVLSDGTEPEGWEFVAHDSLRMPIHAVVLNSNDQANEEQQRAADTLVKTAEIDDAPTLQPEVTELLDAFGSKLQTTSRSNDTLFVLDTSANTEAWTQQAKAAISETVQALAPDHDAALVNYSSPLSPGVSKGWRDNVGFDEDTSISQALANLGTGGQPQTREAIEHAVGVAREHGGQSNIIVITSGTSDADENQNLNDLLARAAQDGIHVSVLHVGQTDVDQQLREAVEGNGGFFEVIEDPTNLSMQVERFAGLA